MSQRDAILDAVKAKLVAANVAAGRVYRSRREQLETLPAVEIEQGGMQSGELAIGVTDHQLIVTVAVVAKGDTPDSTADPVLLAAHAALMADLSLGLGNDVQLRTSWETAEPDIDNFDYVRHVHRYQVDYRTSTGAF
jgi:hypothetical protein